jgi:glutathione-regulated potassium-efflux system ancillary protein KefG
MGVVAASASTPGAEPRAGARYWRVNVPPGRPPRGILVLLAHPSFERSEVTRPMAAAAAALDGITLVDLYAEYPTFDIDVDREQERLLAHDAIVLLHPLYWYSTPALLKEWQDLVLEYGFAYGAGGTRLRGKIFFSALSAGGPETAYCAGGYNQFPIRELLRPLEQTAHLCGMTYLPPFVLFAARRAVEDGRLEGHLATWRRLLSGLRDDALDLEWLRAPPPLGEDLTPALRGEG